MTLEDALKKRIETFKTRQQWEEDDLITLFIDPVTIQKVIIGSRTNLDVSYELIIYDDGEIACPCTGYNHNKTCTHSKLLKLILQIKDWPIIRKDFYDLQKFLLERNYSSAINLLERIVSIGNKVSSRYHVLDLFFVGEDLPEEKLDEENLEF